MTDRNEDGALDRDELLEQLFHRALQQPLDERRDWLIAACHGDTELTEELLGLVCAHAEPASCFDDPAWTPGRMLAADGEELSPGCTIGPYVVGRLLGEGGMGVVYLAEQCEPLRRQVALKVIKPGMDTREVLARFNAERQVLARLSHPHVASVHDAGVTPRGRPYFVMEFVDGEPITRFCDRRRLGIAERLALFELVCDAVQHAHQKGVVHRDLKPGNILVSDDEGRARPKIIDFGVAKAMSAAPGRQTGCTRVGQQIGTPGYMSPEQAEPDRGVVDTRTDVYSLGVLLHELLVGALPRDARRLEQLGPEGLARELAETNIVAPSQRLAALGVAGRSHAARRDTDLRGLLRRLRGDLDWIVLKAVATDPDERYASASELAADVNNSLAGLPLTAGPPGFFYRARRLASAHRGTVTSAAVMLLALLAWPTVVAYLRGQELARYDIGASPPSSIDNSVVDESCAVCRDEPAAVFDTVLVSNAGSAALAVGDLVEFVGETTLGGAVVMAVVPANADSGRAPLGPVSTALQIVQPESAHSHAVGGTIEPGGLGRVVVRGTLAWLAVDDSGGTILANTALVVGSSAARAAASGATTDAVVVGTALQDWYGPGPGLIRAYIAPSWTRAAAAPLAAAADRPPVVVGGGGLAHDQDQPATETSAGGAPLIEAPNESAPGHKLLPSSMPTSSGARNVVGVAAAASLAPDVSTAQGVGLLSDIVDGGTLSNKAGSGTGGWASLAAGTGAGALSQGTSLQGAEVPEEEDLTDSAPRPEQVWGDINGDGLDDVIITAGGVTTVLANLGQGLFADRTLWAALSEGFVGRQLTLKDVDGDEVLDLLALDDSGRLQLHQGLGDGRFVPATVAAGLAELPPLLHLAVIDPEGDGAPDLQLLTRAGDLLFLLNDGRATFIASVLQQGPAESKPAPASNTFGVAGVGGAGADEDNDENGADDTPVAGGGQGGSQLSNPGDGR